MKATLPLLISVDVESDHWAPTRGDKRFSNLQHLSPVVRRLVARGLRPTLLPTYTVVSDPASAERLAELAADGRVELGAHLHPWSTPPRDEALGGPHSMLCNLPDALVAAKLDRLTRAVAQVAGRRPTTFRAGRWALGPRTVPLLVQAGYAVDCSVMPYTSWVDDHGPDFDGAPLRVYRLDAHRDPREPGTGPLVEVPLTVGFSAHPFAAFAWARRRLHHPRLKPTRLAGVAHRAGVVRRIVGSPEMASGAALAGLAGAALREGADCVHFALHSQSLSAGSSPFAPSSRAAAQVVDALFDAVDRLAARYALRGMTVGEAGRRFAPP